MTKTSSFGTSKRESHDSSDFYNRNLYYRFFHRPASKKELSLEVPSCEGWADEIYAESSTHMTDIPENGVALAFTSPPYNVGKDYDEDMGFDEYLELIRNVGQEVS